MINILADFNEQYSDWLVFDKFDCTFKIVDPDGNQYGMPFSDTNNGQSTENIRVAYKDHCNNEYTKYNGQQLYVIYNKSNSYSPCVESSLLGNVVPLRNVRGQYIRNRNDDILCAYKDKGLKFVPLKDETENKIVLDIAKEQVKSVLPTAMGGILDNLLGKTLPKTAAKKTELYCNQDKDGQFNNACRYKQAVRHPMSKNRVEFHDKNIFSPKTSFQCGFANGEYHFWGQFIYSPSESNPDEALVPVVYKDKYGNERSSYKGKQIYLKLPLNSKEQGFLNTEQGRMYGIIRFLDNNGQPIVHARTGKILCGFKNEKMAFIPFAKGNSLELDQSTWDNVKMYKAGTADTIIKCEDDLQSNIMENTAKNQVKTKKRIDLLKFRNNNKTIKFAMTNSVVKGKFSHKNISFKRK